MFFSARNCQMLRALWAGALSATTLISSCTLSEANATGSLCRLADWSSGPVARTHCGPCLWHRRTWSTWLWLLILTVLNEWMNENLYIAHKKLPHKNLACSQRLAFFSIGHVRDFHWQLWRLVSRSYSKIHVSSPVMTLRSKSGSVWRCSMMYWYTCMQHSFWSPFSSLGTISAETLCMPKSSVIIFQTLSSVKSSWLVIFRTVNQLSPRTTCLTHLMLTSVLLAEGLPLLESSSTSSHPSLISCATQKHVCATWCYLHALAEVFQVLVMEFSPTAPDISGLFIAWCSLFVPQCS